MTANIEPSTNGPNGRDDKGRFLAGNPGGPGNPHVKSVAAWRNALTEAVSPDEIACVVRKLVAKAKEGQPWAVRELLDRTLGKAQQRVEVEANVEQGWLAMVGRFQAIEDDADR